eukprot:6809982-Alexandrium_andersonii.AAC.1
MLAAILLHRGCSWVNVIAIDNITKQLRFLPCVDTPVVVPRQVLRAILLAVLRALFVLIAGSL